MSDVSDQLDRLAEGTATLEQVADVFRERVWPLAPRPETVEYTDLARRDLADPDAAPEGSFLEVAAAWSAGKLNDDQFKVLSEAAAEAMKAPGGEPHPGTSAVTSQTIGGTQ